MDQPLDASLAPPAWSIIWTGDREVLWETEWVREFLGPVARGEAVDPSMSIVPTDAIVVVSDDGRDAGHSARLLAYLDRYASCGRPFGLVHLGDEWFKAPLRIYDAASFVIRAGHWSNHYPPKVLAIPLGPSARFVRADGSQGMKAPQDRQYLWSFLGQIRSKPTRRAMIDAFASMPDGYLFETFRWNDPRRLTDSGYRGILSETVFSLCPRGWTTKGYCSVDSFRVYESAEVGAIPLVDSPYYRQAFDAPFPVVRPDWSDGPSLVRTLLSDQTKLVALQETCSNWWMERRRQLRETVELHLQRWTTAALLLRPPSQLPSSIISTNDGSGT
jgi:hypothetical protein